MIGTQLLGVHVGDPGAVHAAAPAAIWSRRCRWIRPACNPPSLRRSRLSRQYHRAKYLQMAIIGLGGLTLLLWSFPLRWQLCVPLGALLASGLASEQWAYYKKHLQPDFYRLHGRTGGLHKSQ